MSESALTEKEGLSSYRLMTFSHTMYLFDGKLRKLLASVTSLLAKIVDSGARLPGRNPSCATYLFWDFGPIA